MLPFVLRPVVEKFLIISSNTTIPPPLVWMYRTESYMPCCSIMLFLTQPRVNHWTCTESVIRLLVALPYQIILYTDHGAHQCPSVLHVRIPRYCSRC